MRRLLLLTDFFVILFAVSAVLGMLTGYERSSSYGLVAAILGSVILYLTIAHLDFSWLTARRISVVLISGVTFVSLIFILQYRYQDYTDTPRFILRLGASTTFLPNLNFLLPHPNAVATLIEGVLPFSLVLAVSRRRLIYRMFGVACALVMLYALLLTFSRGAFVGIAAAVLIAFLSRSRRFALFAGAGILVVVIAFFVLYDLRNVTVIADAFSWASGRLELYQNSLYVASDYFFTGIGLGNTFAMVYSRYGILIHVPFLTYAHNLPLSVWMGQGLLGLTAFLGLLISFYVLVIHVLRTARARSVFYGAWMGVTATLIHGFFDARQYVESAWLMPVLFLLIGLTVATARLAISEAHTSEHPAPRSRNLLPAFGIAAIGLILVSGIFVFSRQIQAAWNTNQGALEETTGELKQGLSTEERLSYYESARRHYRDALALDENWPNANRRLGNLNVNLEDFDESVSLLERAFASEPKNPASIKGLGLAYTWVGQIDEAVNMFNLMPNPREVADELDVWGYYRSQEGDYLLSAYAFETSQMVRGDPASVPAWMRLGGVYLRAERLDDARRWYERVLEVEPDNSDALRILSEIGVTG